MDKIKHSYRINISNTKLYLDDLVTIVDILRGENFENIEIKTQSFKYSDSELNMIKEGDFVEEICASGSFLFSINFPEFSKGYIFASEDSTNAIGLTQKISDILK